MKMVSQAIQPFTQLYWLRRFGKVRRFHLQEMIGEQTVFHHSAGVALILIKTSVKDGEPSAALLSAAILHDLEEGVTSDVSAPVKWDQGFNILENLERRVRERYCFGEGYDYDLNPREKDLLNAADFLDCAWTCLDQLLVGNIFIDVVFRNLEQYEGRSAVIERTKNEKMDMIWKMIHDTYQAARNNAYKPLADNADFWSRVFADASHNV